MSEPTQPIPVHNWQIQRLPSRSKRCWMARLDADDVSTTPIASIAGRILTTRSGTAYQLIGPPPFASYHFAGPDDAPLDKLGEGFRPFYLADGVTPWPPGSVVPALDAGDL